ncbi:class I mannose-6-phosphate isomerase [Pedomonas mirosovicensis]|uniref:class I mannose-6-phosphate isomerase n=1 Tax=Pedomonas mirosovicensis TaxID=2908641 RepID=UPI00216A36EC|nr:class I mannose-6-phosphate isomerase [Pedomonas mirosovicensis]MCH8686223.1 class I mannose-6-phosphate isomerase [Pedomonas mirosovicensis]
MKLSPNYVEKPWGRTELPSLFTGTDGRRIGEVWFAASAEQHLPILVKYIFTSERLSIQVHPNDAEAQERGLPAGKTECWYILDAEPGATLGLGLTKLLSPEELRAAALDGSIEELMDWKPVKAGDFFYVPAGTVHAIGAGISLLEVQQNVDVTYRLYDYGRPRELHLDDGVAVSKAGPYPESLATREANSGNLLLVDGDYFSVFHVEDLAAVPAHLSGKQRWVMPLSGEAQCGEHTAGPGECLYVPANAALEKKDNAVILLAAAV